MLGNLASFESSGRKFKILVLNVKYTLDCFSSAKVRAGQMDHVKQSEANPIRPGPDMRHVRCTSRWQASL